MPTIESYLDTATLPQAAKADAWEAYQAPDHDSFKASLDKLSVPQTVKADMYEMRYGANSVAPASVPAPPNPILNGPESKYVPNNQTYDNGMLHGWDKPTIDPDKIPLYHNNVDPNSTSTASQVAQHTAKFIADQTTPKNAAIMGGIEFGAPALAAGVEAAGPALGYGADAVASGAAKVASGAHRVVGGYFGAMGAKGAYQGYKKTAADYAAGKPIAGDVTDTALSAGMAGLGLRGLAHDGTPPATPAPSIDSPVADHANGSRNESLTQGQLAIQGHLFTDQEHSVPSAPVAANVAPDTTNQFVTAPIQGRLFSSEGEPLPAKPGDVGPDRVPNTLSVLGDALPAQQATAGPMSPEAEAISAAAQKQVEVSQQAPQEQPKTSTPPPEGPTDSENNVSGNSSDTPVKALEDKIRTQTGQVMRLDQLVQSNKVNAALARATDETLNFKNPRARGVGPGISPEDQKMASIALGEPVGKTLTDDQLEKAYQLRGKVLGDKPDIQNRSDASQATILTSREEMAKDLANTHDPLLKAKLQAALQPDENGDPKTLVYKAQRKNVEPIDLTEDHPEAPFSKKTFGQTYPDITMKNLEAALGYKPRSLDLGMGDPEMKKALAAQKAPAPTVEGTGTVNANTNGFTYESKNNPKGYEGDSKVDINRYIEGSTEAMRQKIASSLHGDVKAYQNLRDASKPSPLIDQLKGLHPDSLPKEVQELVQPPKPQTRESAASTSNGQRPQTSEARATTATSPTSVIGKAKAGIVSLWDHFQKNAPEHLGDAKKLVDKAAERFGNDTNGALVATHQALKIFKKGIDEGNDWALRDGIKMINRLAPAEGANEGSGSLFDSTSGARTVDTRGGKAQFNTGLDPEIAKGIAKDIKNAVKPRPLSDSDRIATSDSAANSYLSRYEKMAPTNRAAYKADLWSDETDRKIQEGDPDNTKGYKQRLEALRGTTAPEGFYGRMKGLMSDLEDRIMASDDAKRVIQRANGYRAGYDLQMRTTFNKFSKILDGWSNFEARDFIDKMERRLDQGDDFKNKVADALRKSLDDARDRITAVNGNFQEYLENYFPHIWANVGKGMELSKQTGGMTGNESFLKGREHDLFNRGIEQGLSPVSFNPVKLVMMRVEQMNRYAMKEEIAKDFIASGKAQFIQPGMSQPEGTSALDDPAFQRAAGLGGKYYAPNAVADVFNNFVSRGLAGRMRIPLTQLSAYDAFRAIGNTENQFQLGLSGLHATFTTMNSFISENARGMATFANGLLRGDTAAAAEGLKTSLGAFNVRQRYLLGRNLIAHMKDPETFQEMSSVADAFHRAGGRVGMDKLLGTSYADKLTASYKEAIDKALPKGQKAAAIIRTVFNSSGWILEKAAIPIMEKLVPNLKAGSFAMAAQEILAKHADESSDFIDSQLQRTWDNMDDRFGQPVYDNYFMNKMTKDIAMVTMRSPGWNFGTARAGYGGIVDAAKSIRDAVTKKERIQITDRTAYLGSLVATTMATNAIMQLGMTGHGPSSLIDYFFPKTGSKDANGEENRLMPKTYVYDFINMARSPITTPLHKMSPLLGTVNDLIANKTFYGREIYSPGSSLGAHLARMAGYAFSQYEPFSYTNAKEALSRGTGLAGSFAGSILGINPAPKWAGRTSAENLAAEYHAQSMASGGEEGDLYDKHQNFQKIQAQIVNGHLGEDELNKRIASGEIPIGLVDHVFSKQQTPNLERWTKGLRSPHRAMEIFDRATPQEKERLMPIMLGYLDKLDPSEMPDYAAKLEASQHHPETHVFSVSKYATANPGADHQAAASQAQAQGYEVHK